MHAALAAAYGQLGEREAAEKALQGSARSCGRTSPHRTRESCEKWWEPEYVEHLIDGLRKAGLEIAAAPTSSTAATGSSARSPLSGAARADEGFWVAVLPFKYTAATRTSTALAEGLTEEIVTGLSRFSYLRVIARGSTRDTPTRRPTCGPSAGSSARAT